MENIVLTAKLRTGSGKGVARQLRLKGRVPGVFYLLNEENITFDVERFDLLKLLRARPSLINLAIGDEDPRECVFREMQLDPVNEEILHIDLMGFKRGQKLRITVPVHLIGIPEGVKNEGGILQHGTTELEIECMPRHIPRSIDLDVSELSIGDAIHLGELDYPDFKFFADEQIVIAMVSEPAILKEDIEEEEDEDEEGEEEETESSEEATDKE